jgi:hypothetical protein
LLCTNATQRPGRTSSSSTPGLHTATPCNAGACTSRYCWRVHLPATHTARHLLLLLLHRELLHCQLLLQRLLLALHAWPTHVLLI